MSTLWRAVLMFGPPGSGKGTQAKNLLNLYPFVHVSTGDIFRSIPKTSELAKELASYSSKGLLVPDALTTKIWQEYVEGLIKTFRFDPSSQLLLLDGIPRTGVQAEQIKSLVDVLLIFNLQIPNEAALIERLAKRARIEGRADDAKESVILQRLEAYHTLTRDVLEHYPSSLVAPINADQSPNRVLSEVLPHLDRLPQNK